jgi:hypothetical protein
MAAKFAIGPANREKLTMHTFTVKYYVDGVGSYEEQVRAASEPDVRRLVAAKFPGKYVRVIQVTRVD